jgi:hypothetical protein
MKHIEWKTITLPLMTEEDEEGQQKTVETKEAVGTGLGYSIFLPDDPDEMPYYSIVHIASGRKMHSDPVLIEELAKRMVIAFLPLTDWTVSLDTLVADPLYQDILKKMHEVYVEVDQTFWTKLGEAREWTFWGQ